MPKPITETLDITDTDLNLSDPVWWTVRILNDDYTPMDFVLRMLAQHFGMGPDEALKTTMTIHNEGEVRVGAYTKEIAETKVGHVEIAARSEGHPLRLEAVEC